MTTLAKLLARKQRLLERLQEGPGPHEREEIERQLEEIDTALHSLDVQLEQANVLGRSRVGGPL